MGRQLTAWGDTGRGRGRGPRRASRPIERDLEAVLADLAGSFPLSSPWSSTGSGASARCLRAASGRRRRSRGRHGVVLVAGPVPRRRSRGSQPGSSEAAPPVSRDPRRSGIRGVRSGEDPRRPPPRAPGTAGRRSSLSIQFVERGEDVELGAARRIHDLDQHAHPAYRRAVASRSEGYHVAVTAALALAPLAVEPAAEHAFVTAFLGSWGAALDRARPPLAAPSARVRGGRLRDQPSRRLPPRSRTSRAGRRGSACATGRGLG